jgi:CCR4-NOT transcriptional regulation complex NOT5 subunit
MPVGALSSARDLRSNLSNPAPSSRQIANSGSATARDRVPEKDARKSHTLQPYIPTAAAAVAAAAAAAADVTIPSVPSLNLAAVSSDVGASCRPPTVAAATKPLSDAASLEQAAFLKQVRAHMYRGLSDCIILTLSVTVGKGYLSRD